MFDNQHDWHEAAQMGVANYGQMTAGGWMYIGPQGIVHGTFNTLLNAGRLKLGIPQDKNLSGHLFVSSGLGGMSGAQPKAAEIAGAASIIAEVDRSRIETRYKRGWVEHVTTDLHTAFRMALSAAERHESCSVAYHGNVVDLLEYAFRKIFLLNFYPIRPPVTLFTKVGIVLPELLSKNVPGCCMNLPKRFVSW